MEQATRAAEHLYSTSTDERTQLVAGVFIELMLMPRTEFVEMPSEEQLDEYISSSECKCPGACTCD